MISLDELLAETMMVTLDGHPLQLLTQGGHRSHMFCIVSFAHLSMLVQVIRKSKVFRAIREMLEKLEFPFS